MSKNRFEGPGMTGLSIGILFGLGFSGLLLPDTGKLVRNGVSYAKSTYNSSQKVEKRYIRGVRQVYNGVISGVNQETKIRWKKRYVAGIKIVEDANPETQYVEYDYLPFWREDRNFVVHVSPDFREG